MDQQPTKEKSRSKAWLIFKIIAILVVILFVVILIVLKTAHGLGYRSASKVVAQSYMDQMRAVAVVYITNNVSYIGFEKEPGYVDLCKKMAENGTPCIAQIQENSYCVKAKIKEDSLCVDSENYDGTTTDQYCTAEKPYCVEPASASSTDNGIDATSGVNQIPEDVAVDLRNISPNGGEHLKKGSTAVIRWEWQKRLEHWGNVATICLEAFDKEKNAIVSKGPKNGESELCYNYPPNDSKPYLVAETDLSKGEYQWTIPMDISDRFEELPAFYKINVYIIDNLPPEGRTGWAGTIAGDSSDNYFSID